MSLRSGNTRHTNNSSQFLFATTTSVTQAGSESCVQARDLPIPPARDSTEVVQAHKNTLSSLENSSSNMDASTRASTPLTFLECETTTTSSVSLEGSILQASRVDSPVSSSDGTSVSNSASILIGDLSGIENQSSQNVTIPAAVIPEAAGHVSSSSVHTTVSSVPITMGTTSHPTVLSLGAGQSITSTQPTVSTSHSYSRPSLPPLGTSRFELRVDGIPRFEQVQRPGSAASYLTDCSTLSYTGKTCLQRYDALKRECDSIRYSFASKNSLTRETSKITSELNTLKFSYDHHIDQLPQLIGSIADQHLHEQFGEYAQDFLRCKHSPLEARVDALRDSISNISDDSAQVKDNHEAIQNLESQVSELKAMVHRLIRENAMNNRQLRRNRSRPWNDSILGLDEHNGHDQPTSELGSIDAPTEQITGPPSVPGLLSGVSRTSESMPLGAVGGAPINTSSSQYTNLDPARGVHRSSNSMLLGAAGNGSSSVPTFASAFSGANNGTQANLPIPQSTSNAPSMTGIHQLQFETGTRPRNLPTVPQPGSVNVNVQRVNPQVRNYELSNDQQSESSSEVQRTPLSARVQTPHVTVSWPGRGTHATQPRRVHIQDNTYVVGGNVAPPTFHSLPTRDHGNGFQQRASTAPHGHSMPGADPPVPSSPSSSDTSSHFSNHSIPDGAYRRFDRDDLYEDGSERARSDRVSRNRRDPNGDTHTRILRTERKISNLCDQIENLSDGDPTFFSRSTIEDMQKLNLPRLESKCAELNKLSDSYESYPVILTSDNIIARVESVIQMADIWITRLIQAYSMQGVGRAQLDVRHRKEPIKFGEGSPISVFEFLKDFENYLGEVGSTQDRASLLFNKYLKPELKIKLSLHQEDYDYMRFYLLDRFSEPRIVVEAILRSLTASSPPNDGSASQALVEYYTSLESAAQKLAGLLNSEDVPQGKYRDFYFGPEFLHNLSSKLPRKAKAKFVETLYSHSLSAEHMRGQATYEHLMSVISRFSNVTESLFRMVNQSENGQHTPPKKGKQVHTTQDENLTHVVNSPKQGHRSRGKGSGTKSHGPTQPGGQAMAKAQSPTGSQPKSPRNVSSVWQSKMSQQSWPCPILDHKHPIYECVTFLLTPPEGRRALLGSKICQGCLGPVQSCNRNCGLSVPDALKCFSCHASVRGRNLPARNVLVCSDPSHKTGLVMPDVGAALDSYFPSFDHTSHDINTLLGM